MSKGELSVQVIYSSQTPRNVIVVVIVVQLLLLLVLFLVALFNDLRLLKGTSVKVLCAAWKYFKIKKDIDSSLFVSFFCVRLFFNSCFVFLLFYLSCKKTYATKQGIFDRIFLGNILYIVKKVSMKLACSSSYAYFCDGWIFWRKNLPKNSRS